MKTIFLWGAGVCLSAAGYSQTAVDLGRQGRNIDFTGATFTRPFKTGLVLPILCVPGDAFLKLDSPPGQNLYTCITANSWTRQGTAIPDMVNRADQVLSNDGTSLQWRALGGDISGRPDGITVSRIQGRRISPSAPADGSLLRWSETASEWQPGGSEFSGTVGVPQGGTGANEFAARAVLTGGGTGPLQASGCAIDGGSLTCGGALAIGMDSNAPGESLVYDAAGVNYYSWLAPPAIAVTTRFRLPTTQPTAGQTMVFGAPSGGISATTFANPLLADTPATLQNKTLDPSTHFSGFTTWSESGTPSAADAGSVRVYAKAGTGLCWMGSSGAETCAAGGSSASAGTPYSCPVTATSSVECQHGLGTTTPWVACYDGGGMMLGSSGAATSVTAIVANSANQATITFSDVTSGTCVISTGSMGPQGPQGPAGTGTGANPAGAVGDLQMNGGAGFAPAVPGTDYYKPGSLVASEDLPNPAAAAGGKVQSKACGAGQHVAAINTDSTVTCSPDSGGSGSIFSTAGSGYWCPWGCNFPGQNGSTAMTAARVWYFQITIPAGMTVRRIGFSVQTAAAASSVKWALYSDSSGSPGVLLGAESAPVDASTAAWKIATLGSEAVLSGGVYWLAVISNGAPKLGMGSTTLNTIFNLDATPRKYRQDAGGFALPANTGSLTALTTEADPLLVLLP